jgi:hypothetical protein
MLVFRRCGALAEPVRERVEPTDHDIRVRSL